MRPILKGSTDQSVVIRIVDAADGTPETGVVFDTAGIDLEYRREGGLSVDITEATLATVDAAHSDGGFIHIGNGYYRLDLPDAAVATGANGVLVHGTVPDMVVIGTYIPLVNYNPYDGVRMGMTALPNAAADAAGGLPISDAGGLDLDAQIGTGIDAILEDTADMQPKIPSRQWVSGTVGATVTSATIFQVDVALDTAANSHKFMELTLIRSTGIRERQRILSHTRVDANTINVTLANALASVPTTGDEVVMM